MSDPARRLAHGDEFPYDAPDEWWRATGGDPPAPRSWAHRAARGVIADLQDRRGIKWSFDDIDEDTRAEVVESLAEIIRLARVAAPDRRYRVVAASRWPMRKGKYRK